MTVDVQKDNTDNLVIFSQLLKNPQFFPVRKNRETGYAKNKILENSYVILNKKTFIGKVDHFNIFF